MELTFYLNPLECTSRYNKITAFKSEGSSFAFCNCCSDSNGRICWVLEPKNHTLCEFNIWMQGRSEYYRADESRIKPLWNRFSQ